MSLLLLLLVLWLLLVGRLKCTMDISLDCGSLGLDAAETRTAEDGLCVVA